MARCPNINLPEWKQLVAAKGEDLAYFLWDNYNGDIPPQEYTDVAGFNSVTPKVKELIGYVTADLDNLVKSAGNAQIDMFDGEAGKRASNAILSKYKAANAFVRQNIRKVGDIAFVDDVIKRGETEATGALRYVLSGSKEGAERLEKLRRQFEPDEFNVLSGYMLGRMGMPTGSAAGASELGEQAAKSGAEAMAEAGFSPNRFVTNWNNLSKEAKEALFGGTEYADLAPALDDLVFFEQLSAC